MKRMLKKVLKITAWIVGILLILVVGFCFYVWQVSDIKPPKIDKQPTKWTYEKLDSNAATYGNNWIRKSTSGLYEMYVEGDPYERGIANGILSRHLIESQEIAFTNEIKEMIPSPAYLKFLKYIIGFMNRDLADHITDEYKEEIYGISQSASDSFLWIGSNYSRQLNYHAAHDIGHALQNMMLVGCTSFAAWDTYTENGALLIGRNFDFWVGDEFAKNKLIEFVNPHRGFKFAFVTWGGFIGVVSGMNEKGLTVTINAAKSDIPFGAATPVSLVAREILQYAGNIQEAIDIARNRKMFVSESFLIGSATDHNTVIIEKTPETVDVYSTSDQKITCTNHYQSKKLSNQKLNKTQMLESASAYRYNRTVELMDDNFPLSPQKMASILRDQKGLNGSNIGWGNEKAINQLIAHHSIIFMPDSLKFWVSTEPWQLGTYVCYDLRKIFAMNGLQKNIEVANTSENIAPDSFLYTDDFQKFLLFRDAKLAWMKKGVTSNIQPWTFTLNNPQYYDAYRLAGDVFVAQGKLEDARAAYLEALTKVIATEPEKRAIQDKIHKIELKLQQKQQR
jgi:isopenicillin-N N-acyltransferase-like protein